VKIRSENVRRFLRVIGIRPYDTSLNPTKANPRPAVDGDRLPMPHQGSS